MCGSLFKSFGCVCLFTDEDSKRVSGSLLRVCVCVGLFADVDAKRICASRE